MKPIRLLLVGLALIGLSGCYTSEQALVTDGDAVAPYAKITFQGRGDDDEPATFTRDGTSYLAAGEGGDMRLHLKPVDVDFYVAQLSGEGGDGEAQYLYAYMRLDAAAKVAETWKTVGTKADVRPGLRECKDGICIDDLEAYIAYAKEGIAAGNPPDTTFDIVVE